ncbi:MAG: YhbY family RNA-binding protein [Defluviitaleaceae bacterium]|nr:YhbY family RNA-binding protein [Defluviitaleaceae bacterium]MCL2836078.1 YhbY family RNA-binding protein [Defluviitaleaceae bacterium]
MNSRQRAHLRGLANGLGSIIMIGKAGVTPEVVKMVDEALTARELIKVAMLDNTDTPVADAARMMSERTRSELVQVIGRKIILYRKPKDQHAEAKIMLPK